MELASTLDRRRNEIKGLCELDSRWNMVFIALEWLSIFLIAYGTQKFFSPVSYFLAVLFIGSRFHALGILMHEAAHYRLFKNRQLGEFVGEVFLAWPITMTLKGYRNEHLAHHQYLNTAEDPDWDESDRYYRFPKTRKQMAYTLLENAFGIGFFRELARRSRPSTEYERIPLSLRVLQLSFFAVIAGCSVAFSFWQLLLLYWAVPLITAALFFDYVRAIAEHYGLEYSDEMTNTRNTIASFWESIFIAPYNVGLHLDHHLHPGVPWNNLARLHAVLLSDPEYRRRAHITESGYFRGVLNECTQSSVRG